MTSSVRSAASPEPAAGRMACTGTRGLDFRHSGHVMVRGVRVEIAAAGSGSAAAGTRGGAVSRMVVGEVLRRLREAKGRTLAEAGRELAIPEDQIAGLEAGQGTVVLGDVIRLCALYGVADLDERVTLLGLARQANGREWWHGYRDVIPQWFERYLSLEQGASVIRGYEPQFVPGLLQTADYARAVIAMGYGADPTGKCARRAELRVGRQRILYGPGAAHLWVVIDEAALRRPVGGRAVMRAQISHLIDACDMPGVTIQVLPFGLGGHPAGGPIVMLRLPDRQLPDVVYLEHLTGAVYPPAGDFYRHVLNQLGVQAGPQPGTPSLLAEILRDT
jgi:transcriptional regulator with XRE-family HTH domain